MTVEVSQMHFLYVVLITKFIQKKMINKHSHVSVFHQKHFKTVEFICNVGREVADTDFCCCLNYQKISLPSFWTFSEGKQRLLKH